MEAWLTFIVCISKLCPWKHTNVTLAAARALMSVEDMSAEEVAQKAMDVASDMCVYTNKNFLSYTLEDVSGKAEEEEESPDESS